jgi:death-on-curing protein
MIIELLTAEDVLMIHERLVIDAENTEDPISPPGVRNPNLLESAVARQYVGFGDVLKYPDAINNAATLCYGICCNHPLYNGNKRTALVSLMSHLDRNGITFTSKATQSELFDFMLNVASHKVSGSSRTAGSYDISDEEIAAMTEWLNKITRKVIKGERSISYQEFEKLLKQQNCYFENAKNNKIDVIKEEEYTEKKWFKKTTKTKKVKVANIPYWPRRTVGKVLIKSVRKKAGLTHIQGIDSQAFYGDVLPPDDFIHKYKEVLRRLAKT